MRKLSLEPDSCAAATPAELERLREAYPNHVKGPPHGAAVWYIRSRTPSGHADMFVVETDVDDTSTLLTFSELFARATNTIARQ